MEALNPGVVMAALVAQPQLEVFTRNGRIESLPVKHTRRLMLLDVVAQAFEPGVKYSEQEVSDFLGLLHDDYAALRRYLVDWEFLSRSSGVYWRSGGTVPG